MWVAMCLLRDIIAMKMVKSEKVVWIQREEENEGK